MRSQPTCRRAGGRISVFSRSKSSLGKWSRRLKVLALLCEPLEARVLMATTYYVSPFGSDSNNGTTVNTPWLSAAKFNSTAYQPGDQILFANGGEWHSQLTADADGTVGNPITYGSYSDPAQSQLGQADLLG